MIRGIDVSSVQGAVIDWVAVARSGVRFAMLRCGNGNQKPDDAFAISLAKARAAGLVVGCYHVGFPLPEDPAHPGRSAVDQARAHFAASRGLGSRDGEPPPALDLEWPVPGTPDWDHYGCTKAQVRAWALAYLAESARLHGRAPLVYDGFPLYWEGIGGPSEPEFARYPLWWVDYREGTSPPAPWSTWAIHQIDGGGGHLPSGAPVDEDVFNGDEAAFARFLRVSPDVTDGGANRPVPALPDMPEREPDA